MDRFDHANRKRARAPEKPACPPIKMADESASKMVTLKKQGQSADSGFGDEQQSTATVGKNPDSWVQAAEFVPGQLWQGSMPSSYSQAAVKGTPGETASAAGPSEEGEIDMCPYAMQGSCMFGENCERQHGDICELCGLAVLHPTDKVQRDKHNEACVKQHEEAMELSFAVQRSKDKQCGICMDNIMDKPPAERRFGILPNCNHIFCLACIRKWRSARQFEHKLVRACPECRVKSDFVTPSKYWVNDPAEKEKLIQGYKGALQQKPCKYFDQGKGNCPFNQNCFYRHAYPDGRIASPKPQRRRQRVTADGSLDVVGDLLLLSFLEHRDAVSRISFDLDDLDELFMASNMWDWSDTDSDFSEDVMWTDMI